MTAIVISIGIASLFARDRDDDRFDRNQFDFNRDRNDWDRLGRDIRRNWWRGHRVETMPLSAMAGGGIRMLAPVGRPIAPGEILPLVESTLLLVGLHTRDRAEQLARVRLGSASAIGPMGPGRNIYYQDGYVYYDNRRTIATNDYYQDMYELAHSVPNISEDEAQNMDWKPLGVFWVARQNESQGQSQR